MYLPEVIILSTQRSGTHLLLSFLTKHPQINGKGEMFLKFKRTGFLQNNAEGKINVAILMYNHLYYFKRLGGDLKKCKVIHLMRNPQEVALSRLQMDADKKILGAQYKAHFHENKVSGFRKLKRGVPDLSKLSLMKDAIAGEQMYFLNFLKKVVHLEIHYDELLKDGQSSKYLNNDVQKKLLEFLEVDEASVPLHTTYLKTGINFTSEEASVKD